MKAKFKRILDMFMTVALPCLMAYELIGEATHEILGLCMVTLFILHHVMNWSWHKHLFKGRYTAYRTALTVLDCLMIIVFITQAVSGIMMAKHVFPDLPHVGRRSFARVLHLLGAYWGFLLICLHAGMHMTGLWRKWQKNGRKAVKIAVAALLAPISAYGVYAFIQRGFPTYLLLKEQFVFFDYDEPLWRFFADYLTIMILWMTAGSLLGLALQRRRKKK